MTPEEFAERMKKLSDDKRLDEEIVHIAMDELMCWLLISLGYKDGVEIFSNTNKWYS